MLAIAMALVNASECDKPNDWDDELDGVFDSMEHCSTNAPIPIQINPDCEKPNNWDDERDGIFDSGCHSVFFTITYRDPSTYCNIIFHCYDEFGTYLGYSDADVPCDKGCNHYGIYPTFTSTEAVQDYKLEVLRQRLENIQIKLDKMETDVTNAKNIIHDHKEKHFIG